MTTNNLVPLPLPVEGHLGAWDATVGIGDCCICVPIPGRGDLAGEVSLLSQMEKTGRGES